MGRERVFIVEDDEDIQELISYNLVRNSFTVKAFTKGEEFLEYLETDACDLAILDLMLPGMDGLEICKKLKKTPRTENIAVIMLTAKGEESDIITGLELGADDYIVKPFSPKVLIARIKAVLRRKEQVVELKKENVTVGEIQIVPGRYEVTVNNESVELTASEFKALHLLAGRPGWVFTRYQIVESVHGQNYPVTDRSVDVMMVSLRKKLKTAGRYIETVRGIGYRFMDK
ncbi:TPA: DNA-binding response regulator [Candidatus Delongbacteria bacterium]|jgi:two-component system, OmpR family, alkaline phosphatase synthesis response regulator PhoP|nr:DNA-binding response regulator [Candidatus Delongbacteria bacterium]